MKNIIVFGVFLLFFSCQNTTSNNPQNVKDDIIPKGQVEAKLKYLNITLPELKKPLANYVHTVRSGNLVYTAGKGSANPDGSLYTGKLGDDLTIEQGNGNGQCHS